MQEIILTLVMVDKHLNNKYEDYCDDDDDDNDDNNDNDDDAGDGEMFGWTCGTPSRQSPV